MAQDDPQHYVKSDRAVDAVGALGAVESMEWARQFGALARGRERAVRLDLCCLQIGRIVDPRLNQISALARLDDLAAEVRAKQGDPSERVERLNHVLFEAHGLRGDTDTYYDPGNCCLHAALETGRGMPITLAVVMIEVGRRVGLELHGVGTPFHFLVKYRDPASGEDRFLDPFHGGREIDRAALTERLRATNRGAGPNPDSFLAAVTKRQVLQRILTNLKGASVRQRDYHAAIRATDYLLSLSPWSLEERRDRGMLCFQTGQYVEALDDLQQYHEHAGDTPDAGRVADVIERIRLRIAETI